MSRLQVPAESQFGTTNLPYAVYSAGARSPQCCTRLGDTIVDLAGLLGDEVFAAPSLNAFMAEGHDRWVAVRHRIGEAITEDLDPAWLHPVDDVVLHLPIEVADYVDFYASEHHAANLGRLFRPDNPDPLQPNWKHLPVGYHGRAGSIVVSGTEITRPWGQRMLPGDDSPSFGPSTRLDIEAEMGFVVGTPSPMGSRIPAEDAERYIFGAVIFNDWSARDIQAWEYVPLGPNLGKSFASTISPWIVPMLALEHARVPTPAQHPTPLPYLAMSEPWGLDIAMTITWNGVEISHPPYREMYWSPAQMLAHLTVNGAPVRTGDLFASGTVSGPARNERGALIELTWGGAEPVDVGGRSRTFLDDGDEIAIRAHAAGADGRRIGFGEAVGRIVARPDSA